MLEISLISAFLSKSSSKKLLWKVFVRSMVMIIGSIPFLTSEDIAYNSNFPYFFEYRWNSTLRKDVNILITSLFIY